MAHLCFWSVDIFDEYPSLEELEHDLDWSVLAHFLLFPCFFFAGVMTHICTTWRLSMCACACARVHLAGPWRTSKRDSSLHRRLFALRVVCLSFSCSPKRQECVTGQRKGTSERGERQRERECGERGSVLHSFRFTIERLLCTTFTGLDLEPSLDRSFVCVCVFLAPWCPFEHKCCFFSTFQNASNVHHSTRHRCPTCPRVCHMFMHMCGYMCA